MQDAIGIVRAAADLCAGTDIDQLRRGLGSETVSVIVRDSLLPWEQACAVVRDGPSPLTVLSPLVLLIAKLSLMDLSRRAVADACGVFATSLFSLPSALQDHFVNSTGARTAVDVERRGLARAIVCIITARQQASHQGGLGSDVAEAVNGYFPANHTVNASTHEALLASLARSRR